MLDIPLGHGHLFLITQAGFFFALFHESEG